VPTFQIAGHSVEFKADTVRQRLRGVGPEKIQVWGVEIDGRMYSVVQALEAASGVPRGVTRSARARWVLGALGFRVTRSDPSAQQLASASPSPEKTKNSPPSIATRSFPTSWATMDAQPRHPVPAVRTATVPNRPGVYAFYCEGDRVYIGRAIATGGLRKRLCGMHLLTGADVSWSAFRRNVAEAQGVPTSVTRAHADTLTDEQLDLLNRWVAGCEVDWIECSTAKDAAALEVSLKAEYKLPLTKR